MGDPRIRIATRGSDLALWQANWVRDQILRTHPVEVEVIIVRTEGDRQADRPIRAMEGVGFFTKEIELAVLDGKSDVAVHSFKDLPTAGTPGLTVAAVPPRGSPEDWLLVRRDRTDTNAACWPLRPEARVGTSSRRRAAQLQHRRSDLVVVELRGNVPTRIERLRGETMDAVVLARAGLDRLGLDLSEFLVVDLLADGFLPAPGQGALAVQCRADDSETISILSGLNDPATDACVRAERLLLSMFEGGCSLALGCLARVADTGLELHAVWFNEMGERRSCSVSAETPDTVARLAFEGLSGP